VHTRKGGYMMKVRTMIGCAIVLAVAAAAVGAATVERLYADPEKAPGYDIAVGGGCAYVSGNDGVSIYDVRDPESPELVVEPEWLGGPAFGLWIEEGVLYVAAIEQGLLIVDISDPSDPAIVGRYPGRVGDVFVYRGVAYISGFSANLRIVDVSNPESPSLVAEFGWSNANGAAAFGDYVYITDPSRGIVALDVSDPVNPTEVGVLFDSGGANRLEVSGDWLIAAMYSRGLRAYDLTNPRSPRLRFSHADTGEAWDAAGDYPILCVADLQEGVEVIDASAPYSAREIAADVAVAPHAIEYEDGYIHLADQDEGYVLFRLVLDP
jgi:hypothetical protein